MASRKQVGVTCEFSAESDIHITRIQIDTQWLPVTQGRHWYDAAGLHVLVMRPDGTVRELLLNRETLRWEMAGTGREQGVA
jgi:hypothetical protein